MSPDLRTNRDSFMEFDQFTLRRSEICSIQYETGIRMRITITIKNGRDFCIDYNPGISDATEVELDYKKIVKDLREVI